MHVGALLAHTCLCSMCLVPTEVREGARSSGTGTGVLSHHAGTLSSEPPLRCLTCPYYSHSWDSGTILGINLS